MNAYELTVVLSGKATPAKVKTFKIKMEKAISGLKGKVAKVEDWGKIDFAYNIQKNTSGTFLQYNLELEPESIKLLKNKIKLESDIIRYLLIRK